MDIADQLRKLADKFSAGWHDGFTVDASDVMTLTEAAALLERLMQAVESQRERYLAAIEFARGENVGHKDYETYDDGFTDACNECETAIKKVA